MIRIEDIIEKVAVQFPTADLDLLRRAYFFAAREHKGQTLPSGEPSFARCLEAANMLADLGQDDVCVSAGLLCYILEETLVDLGTIKQYFGDDLANIIDKITKPVDLSLEVIKPIDLSDEPRIGTVKLAAHLSTLRRLILLTENERDQIVTETVEIYIPLAHKLGFDNIRREYEILVYPYI